MNTPKFPCRIYIEEHVVDFHGQNNFFWKSLCIVYDNEAFGLIERLLQNVGIEYKTEAA